VGRGGTLALIRAAAQNKALTNPPETLYNRGKAGGVIMASTLEVKERQKHHLKALLTIKKLNEGTVVKGLQDKIEDAVAVMDQEDVAWVEKIVGVKAI
jgi:hypothetical protein